MKNAVGDQPSFVRWHTGATLLIALRPLLKLTSPTNEKQIPRHDQNPRLINLEDVNKDFSKLSLDIHITLINEL